MPAGEEGVEVGAVGAVGGWVLDLCRCCGDKGEEGDEPLHCWVCGLVSRILEILGKWARFLS